MASNGHDDFAQTEIFRPDGPAQSGASVPSSEQAETLPIRFTGSGSEYFRIWIVNLLLILVTLTLYMPFARARRMAYFQNNTVVGQDPLGFHADPWKMFRGYLVVAFFGIGYWSVTTFLPAFGWIALLVFMALWPLLWRASLQFRLRNTSWRGVRLAFLGDSKGAYSVMLPFFLPALAYAVLLPQDPQEMVNDPSQVKKMFMVMGVVTLVAVVMLPWMWKRLKAYQHGGYAYTQERTELSATTWQFYGLFLKVIGLTLLVLLVLAVAGGIIAALVTGISIATLSQANGPGQMPMAVGLLIGTLVAAIYVVVPLVVGSYVGSRMQNLLWSNTHSAQIRMSSALRLWPLMRMSLVNWLLILLTLGLYWPFAKVRMARLKLEAVSVEVQGNVDEWVAQAAQDPRGALGDAAGDFFGIDLGL
jgi:uncharacterized membrane protein YjgN (DUF898 family)